MIHGRIWFVCVIYVYMMLKMPAVKSASFSHDETCCNKSECDPEHCLMLGCGWCEGQDEREDVWWTWASWNTNFPATVESMSSTRCKQHEIVVSLSLLRTCEFPSRNSFKSRNWFAMSAHLRVVTDQRLLCSVEFIQARSCDRLNTGCGS